MKKILFSLLMVCLCQSVSAQSVAGLYREFKGYKGVSNMFIPRLLIQSAGIFTDLDSEDRRILHHIHSVRLMDMEDSSAEVRRNFLSKALRLNTSGYVPVVSSKTKDSRNVILMRLKKEKIKELVVIDAEEDDCGMVIVTCNLSPQDIDKTVEIVNGKMKD